ncbi:MAG: hypothetical protein WA825_04755, partial [Steroidobacteraceae bacterium]
MNAKVAGFIAALLAWAAAPALAATTARVYAARVPSGCVRVLVVVPDGPWPAGGVRIADANGTVLVARVEPDPQAYAQLDGASQAAVTALR